jgi:hypothetical protein
MRLESNHVLMRKYSLRVTQIIAQWQYNEVILILNTIMLEDLIQHDWHYGNNYCSCSDILAYDEYRWCEAFIYESRDELWCFMWF